MQRSNYRIEYWPAEGGNGHCVTVKVSNEFIEFAKRQEIDRKRYEEIGLNIEKACCLDGILEEDICEWEGETGLLRCINIPGNAAGAILEKGIDGWEYHGHNMSDISQASVILGIIIHYLNDIEMRIPRKTK